MARKKKTAEESVSALNAAISQLAAEAAAGTRQYLGEDGLKRLISLIGESLKGKQDTLAQGDNITIEDGVISSKDTGVTSVEASGESPLTLTASYDADTRKMTVGGSVDLEDYALREELQKYLPLTGGEVTGDLKVEKTLTAETIINSQEIDINSEIGRFNNMGETRLTLTENADAPNVVVADGEGKLYSAPASGFSGGGDYLPLTGGTLTGDLTVEGSTALNAPETADIAAEAGILVIGTDGTVRRATAAALAELLEMSQPFVFNYRYDGGNSPTIEASDTAGGDSTSLFTTGGACEVTVNGVTHRAVAGTSLDLGQYMSVGENTVRISPLEGSMGSSWRSGSSSTYRQYITEIVSWGSCKWGTAAYLLAGAKSLTAVPAFTDGFAGVTDFSYCFNGCTGLASIPTGLFDACTAVTTFAHCFNGCTGLTSLPSDLFASCTKVTDFSYCMMNLTKATGESAYDLVEVDGAETVIHLYERESHPDLYTAPNGMGCYYLSTGLNDYGDIPQEWKSGD